MMESIRKKILAAGNKPGFVIMLTEKEWINLHKDSVLPSALGTRITFKLD